LVNCTKSHPILEDLNPKNIKVKEVKRCHLKFTGIGDGLDEIVSGNYKAYPKCISCDVAVFYKRLLTTIKDKPFTHVAAFVRKVKRSRGTTARSDQEITFPFIANDKKHCNEPSRWHLAFTSGVGVKNLPRITLLVGPVLSRSIFRPVTFPVSGEWTLPDQTSMCNASNKTAQCVRTLVTNPLELTSELCSSIRNEMAFQHATAIGMSSIIIQL
jgi:hypothetical protein